MRRCSLQIWKSNQAFVKSPSGNFPYKILGLETRQFFQYQCLNFNILHLRKWTESSKELNDGNWFDVWGAFGPFYWNWNVFVLWWVWRLLMSKTNDTAVIFGFSSSFGSNSTTFKTITILVQFLLSLAVDGKDSEKKLKVCGRSDCSSQHHGRFNFTLWG